MNILWQHTNIFYKSLCFLISENEKLHRSDAKLYWTTVYFLIATLHHIYIGIIANSLDLITYNYDPRIDNLSRFGPFFITGWNFLFQLLFLCLSLLHNILEWLDRHESSIANKISYYRDILFCGIVVPFTLFVSSMFWIIFLIDRELVFPKIYDEVVPWWFNHCVHTNISVVVLVETLLYARRHPFNKKIELIMNGAVGVIYAVVYYSIYFFANRWLYGVFGVMNWWQVCLYQILIWSSTFVFYYIQFPINRLFHKEVIEPQKTVENTIGLDRGQDNPDLEGKPEVSSPWTQKIGELKSQLENSRL